MTTMPATMTVPVSMVTDMLDRLGIPADEPSGAVARAGIAPALLGRPAARVTVEQFAVFYRALVLRYDDETPGFFTRPLRSGTLKFLCLSLLGAPTLQGALHRFCWFFRLVLDDVRFVLHADGRTLAIRLEECHPLGAQRVLILELMLLLVQGVSCWLADQRLALDRVDVAYPAPAHAGEYANMYSGPVFFGQARTRLVFRPEARALPVRQAQGAVSAFLRHAPVDWIRPAIGERSVSHRVRDLLQAQAAPTLSAAQVADRLHLSPRTLARRLAAEGTRFQALKSAVRRDIAIARLLGTRQPVAQIGADLGFEDPAAFNRAFRQWAGMTPGSYRQGRRSEPRHPR
ncbi:AraC family transcriptional regulator [Castellaniella hirudinis]|uniref:AraC family transcriptional regulator n=1 Tax=Castellaniella hirudinis TaxID=1144617 RepID=UPI0039C15545